MYKEGLHHISRNILVKCQTPTSAWSTPFCSLSSSSSLSSLEESEFSRSAENKGPNSSPSKTCECTPHSVLT